MLRQMVPVLRHVGPGWLRRWVVQRFPLASVRRLAEISDTLHERSLEIFRAKKAVIEAGGDADAMDIMSILGKHWLFSLLSGCAQVSRECV